MYMCVYRRKFTRAAFKYAMIGRGGGPTTGVRCRITTAAATRPSSRDNHRRRFRIQSAEFMRASQLDTRPVLFHGNVITRGAGRIRAASCTCYNVIRPARNTGCPATTARGYVSPRWDTASSIIEPRPFTGKYGNCALLPRSRLHGRWLFRRSVAGGYTSWF